MKALFSLLLISLLSACASHNPVTTQEKPPASETLTLVSLEPHIMEVRLDGRMYKGGWSDGRRFTDACRGEFSNVQRIYRRHIRLGEAELLAQDGTRMQCNWVSSRMQIRGTCEAPDGRIYRLEAGDAWNS